jgi:hypothetical protein
MAGVENGKWEIPPLETTLCPAQVIHGSIAYWLKFGRSLRHLT